MYAQYVGHKFGKWTILEYIKKKCRSHYIVACECGRESQPASYHVINGYTSSCNSCAPKKHGFYKTSTYRFWNAARNRCNNTLNKNYQDYGARGIKFSDKWDDFMNFYKDMGEKPSNKSLDRIDNNGNYEPGNCRWATYSEQNSNQRKRYSKLNI